MKGTCISLDVSKGSSFFQAWKNCDEKITGTIQIKHDKKGFEELLKVSSEVEEKTGEKPIFVYEETGVYHYALTRFLESHNETIYIIPSLLSGKQRQSNIRATKTDKLDCKTIAQVYYTKTLRKYESKGVDYSKMKELSTHYNSLCEDTKRNKILLRRTLDIVFPRIDKLWSRPIWAISVALFEKFTHPDQILRKTKSYLTNFLQKRTTVRKSEIEKQVNKIYEYCENCYSGCNENSVYCQEIKTYLAKYKKAIDEQAKCLDELILLAKENKNFANLKTIPGIKDNLSARILAEIGDVSRFASIRKIVAFSGLDPNLQQSGLVSGIHLKITKRGNSKLRSLLYIAVTTTLRYNNKITTFYNKKVSQGMNRKAAKIACMNKLLRIIYSMCKNQTSFKN